MATLSTPAADTTRTVGAALLLRALAVALRPELAGALRGHQARAAAHPMAAALSPVTARA